MTIGIYCIEHIASNKRYIGKSKNIEKRIADHKRSFNKYPMLKGCNRHLWNAVRRHGISAFKFYVVERFDELNSELIAQAELDWMTLFNSCHRHHGYNLRKDSSSGMITHDETRVALSEAQKRRYNSAYYRLFERDIVSERIRKRWAQTPREKIKEIGAATAERMQRYHYLQINMRGAAVCAWRSTRELSGFYAEINIQNVHSVADGHKPAYAGYVWEKIAPDSVAADLYFNGSAPAIVFGNRNPPTPRWWVEVIDPTTGPIERFESVALTAKAYGVSYGYISNCVNGRVKTIKGLIFRKVPAPHIEMQATRKLLRNYIFSGDPFDDC